MTTRRRTSKQCHGGDPPPSSTSPHRRLSTSYATSHRRLLGGDSSRKITTPSSHRFSIHDDYRKLIQAPIYDETYGGIDDDGGGESEHDNLQTIESGGEVECYQSIEGEGGGGINNDNKSSSAQQSTVSSTLTSLPSIILLSILSLMMSVPFGSAYFLDFMPLNAVNRQALGMRLCLLSGAISQVFYGCMGLSTLDPIASIQLAPLTPFYHQFSRIAKAVIDRDNNGEYDESYILPTTLYLISLATIISGISYFIVGKLGYAKVASFFPRYVMLGLVGGCGFFFMCLSICVSVGPGQCSADLSALPQANDIRFVFTIIFVIGIRVLRVIIPKTKFMLLDAVYFLSVPFVFYIIMYVMGVSFEKGVQDGYFFQDPSSLGGADVAVDDNGVIPIQGVWNGFIISHIRYDAAIPALTALLSSALLSIMLVVPFPPLISVYFNTESTFDIDKEFVAHGYANMVIGAVLPGGLFVNQSLANTILFKNSGAQGGKICNGLLALGQLFLGIYGASLVGGIPRCMAGSLMLDMGIELVSSAVSVTGFTFFEYGSTWIILTIMTVSSLTTGLLAGLVLALFNYTQQSFVVESPLRRILDVSKIPSTCLRSIEALDILDNDPNHGRKKVVLCILHGHLFYGNVPRLKEDMLHYLNEKGETSMLIMDLDGVVGIDSSAAALVEKLVLLLENQYNIQTVFVRKPGETNSSQQSEGKKFFSDGIISENSIISGEYYDNVNDALISCEDELLERQNVGLERLEKKYTDTVNYEGIDVAKKDVELERDTVLMLFSKYNAGHASPKVHRFQGPNDIVLVDLVNALTRVTFSKGEVVWKQDDMPKQAVLVLKGCFTQRDGSGYTGEVIEGTIVGLRNLLLAECHRTSLRCDSDQGLAYALDMDGYEKLCKTNPAAARVVDMSMARNLSMRLQSVTNKSGSGLMWKIG